MSENLPPHPDDEIREQARFRQFAIETVDFRFPDLSGPERDEKIRSLAEAFQRLDEAQVEYWLPRDGN